MRSVTVRMTEDETLATRIQYFHRCDDLFRLLATRCVRATDASERCASAGILRDVMVNHLHLLLSLVVSVPSPLSDDDNVAAHATRSLAFTRSLMLDSDTQALLVGQYDAYSAHYAAATGHALDPNSSFVPTAARVQLSSSAVEWRHTAFVLEAAKAVRERRLEVVIAFQDAQSAAPGATTMETAPDDPDASCELRVTLQTRVNDASERIAWSCRFLDGLDPPQGWQHDPYDMTGNGAEGPQCRAMAPVHTDSKVHSTPWTLGDAPSAYDALLIEAVRGTRSHFASIDDALAAWTLWTPIVERAERMLSEYQRPTTSGKDSPSVFIYPTGTTSWNPATQAPSRQRTLETELHDEL